MSACEKGLQWELTLSLLGRMQDVGVPPTSTCCHAAIRACERCQQWQSALALLDRYWDTCMGSGILSLSSALGACEAAGHLHHVSPSILHELRAQVRECLIGCAAGPQTAKIRRLPRRADREGHAAVGYSIVAMTQLRSCDMVPSSDLHRWRRVVQRPVQRRLRRLYALGDSAGAVPPPATRDEMLRAINDLGGPFTGHLLEDLGIRGLPAPLTSQQPRMLRRSVWWSIDRTAEAPEGWSVAGTMSYEIRGVGARPILRCPAKVICYKRYNGFLNGLSAIYMLRDRTYSRAWHAERQGLLGLACRILVRSPTDELPVTEEQCCGWAVGYCQLHVGHTPCLSCMGSICQFQGLFPRVRLSVTYDIWQELRAALRDPWRTLPPCSPCFPLTCDGLNLEPATTGRERPPMNATPQVHSCAQELRKPGSTSSAAVIGLADGASGSVLLEDDGLASFR